METESLTSLDDPRGPALGTATEREFVRPAYKFGSSELWPYTQGSDLLFRQCCHAGDSALTRALKFVFVHVKRGADDMEADIAAHILPLAWETPEVIHLALFRWISQNIKSDADKVAALRLHEKIVLDATKASAEIVGGAGKKKTAARPRRRQRS